MEKSYEDSLNKSNTLLQFRSCNFNFELCDAIDTPRSVAGLYWISINIGVPIGLTAVQCEVLVTGRDPVQLSSAQVVWFANLFRDISQIMLAHRLLQFISWQFNVTTE